MQTKHIDIKEFREKGFLQEANRHFFHPLGLALELTGEENFWDRIKYAWKFLWRKKTDMRLSGVWDYRDDPEGMLYGNLSEEEAYEKSKYVSDLLFEKAHTRLKEYGWVIQPIGHIYQDVDK